MPRPLPVDAYIQPGEETLAVAGRHPRSIIAGIVFSTIFWLLLVLAAAFLLVRHLPASFDPFFVPSLIVLSVLWATGVLRQWWRMRTSRYVITPERVYASRGRLFFVVQQTTYDKVTDLHVRQSLFGRWWGYGDVTVQTAGTGLSFVGVPHPLAVKRRVEEARTGFLAKLIEEYRLEEVVDRPTTSPATAAQEAEEGRLYPDVTPRSATTALWNGRPVFVSALAQVLQGIIMLLVGLGLLARALASAETQPLLLLIGGGFALFGALGILQGWVHYRFTRYEVHPWGVVVTSGWLTRRRVEITYDKVTDVTTYQGFIGRLLNFGNITINTAGSNQAPVSFAGLGEPESVKAVIDEARRARQTRGRRA